MKITASFAWTLAVVLAHINSSDASPRGVDPQLYRALQRNGVANVMVTMRGDPQALLSSGVDSAGLVDRLQAHADRTQTSVLHLLNQTSSDARSYWISNQVFISHAEPALIQKLAKVPSVSSIREEHVVPASVFAAKNVSWTTPLDDDTKWMSSVACVEPSQCAESEILSHAEGLMRPRTLGSNATATLSRSLGQFQQLASRWTSAVARSSNSVPKPQRQTGRRTRGTSSRFKSVPRQPLSSEAARAITEVKEEVYPELDPEAWGRQGFAGSNVCELELDPSLPLARAHARNLTVQQFTDTFERPQIPVMIEGIPEVDGWSATENWQLETLHQKYKDARFKCGEDEDEDDIRIKFDYFVEYMKKQTDDSPLYIFDTGFDDLKASKSLLQDYKVPSYFPEDLFSLVGVDRPQYRWFLVGPKRSGTGIHLDPLGTSAWNTLIVGRKRWILFPPDLPEEVAMGKKFIRKGEAHESVNYFMDILPRIKAAYSQEYLRAIEVIQNPGETIYVPGGWWHAVFNIEDSVAITQNFCSSHNFDLVWRDTRTERDDIAIPWLEKLNEVRPDLAARAIELNREDGFVMKDKDGSRYELQVDVPMAAPLE